jgi:hypothetical protein
MDLCTTLAYPDILVAVPRELDNSVLRYPKKSSVSLQGNLPEVEATGLRLVPVHLPILTMMLLARMIRPSLNLTLPVLALAAAQKRREALDESIPGFTAPSIRIQGERVQVVPIMIKRLLSSSHFVDSCI